ncbi:MAG TPA: TRAP transporter small permease [Vineibacter sp.]|nr:TRAP transporter small permease [Vineibacter sp.]
MTSTTASSVRSLWRRLTAWYAHFLSILVAIAVAVLIVPVSLQIFSRYTPLVPTYIWTEEMARFLFIWTIMIGATVGVRESAHFDCDVWPRMSPRGDAVGRLLGRLGVLAMACIFVWAGVEFTKFAWHRTSELGDLPLWLINIAWPFAGVSWLIFLGEQMVDDLRIIAGRPS